MPLDFGVCFGKEDHAGTKVWMEAVKSSLEHTSDSKWKLPVYEFIRHKLPGRRFFVWSSDSGRWMEAKKDEMRSWFGKQFKAERAALKKHNELQRYR